MKDYTNELMQALREMCEPYASLPPSVTAAEFPAASRALDLLWKIGQEIKAEALAARITACNEDGKIAVIESGRDCDGVEYDGKVHMIDATPEAFVKLDEGLSEWADGPYRLAIERPSVAKGIGYSSRDLVLEAMEEGHPHHIVSRFG